MLLAIWSRKSGKRQGRDGQFIVEPIEGNLDDAAVCVNVPASTSGARFERDKLPARSRPKRLGIVTEVMLSVEPAVVSVRACICGHEDLEIGAVAAVANFEAWCRINLLIV